MESSMIWTGWNNGKHLSSGAGYGFQIDPQDREQYFSRAWSEVLIELPRKSGPLQVQANVAKQSFWNRCPELIAKDIGQWLLTEGHAPWPGGHRPKFEVDQVKPGHFRVRRTRESMTYHPASP